MAVAGLPELNSNQAVARFATECRTKMKRVVKKLEVILGPDTAQQLSMRFGLYSGPDSCFSRDGVAIDRSRKSDWLKPRDNLVVTVRGERGLCKRTGLLSRRPRAATLRTKPN